MANPIIQNYLNDTSIPKEKRQFAIDELKKGVPEEKIATSITSKYGDMYVSPSRKESGIGESSVMDFLNSPDTTSRLPLGPQRPQAPAPQPQDDTSLGGRIKGALSGIVGQAGKGLNTMVVGMEDIKAPQRAKEQADYMIQQAKDQLARDGDQEKFNKKMAVINKMTGSAADRGKLGLSEIFKGTTQTAVSPITGAIEGGLKPELDKFSQFIAGGVEGLDDKNKVRLQKALDTISKFTSKHPALMNYASGGLDIAGVGGVNAIKNLAKKGGKAALQGAKAGAADLISGVKDIQKLGGQAISKVSPELSAIKQSGVNKLKAIKLPGRQTAEAAATDLLSPEVTRKNLRLAAEKGLAVEGKNGLFSGAKDMIKLSPRMEQAKTTLLQHFPDLQKMSSFTIPVKIQQKIGEIASPLRKTFSQIKVPVKTKEMLEKSWASVKSKQLQSFNASKWLKEIHTTFEKDYINKVTKSVKDASGKFRQKNVEDIWNMAIDYDKRYNKLIEAVEKGNSDPKILAQFEAYMDTRSVLRKTMDELAKNMEDVNAKQAFKEMSDLYEAQSAILKNIKPTNKSGESIVGKTTKNILKNVVVPAVGGGALVSAFK